MERNWNRNARAAGGARSQPIDVEDESVEYRDDVSKYTVSLNNTSSQDNSDEAIGRSTGDRSSTGSSSYGAGGAEVSRGIRQGRGGGGRNRGRREHESPADEGAQSEYFSALLNESFCSHEFKLAG